MNKVDFIWNAVARLVRIQVTQCSVHSWIGFGYDLGQKYEVFQKQKFNLIILIS